MQVKVRNRLSSNNFLVPRIVETFGPKSFSKGKFQLFSQSFNSIFLFLSCIFVILHMTLRAD